MLSLEKKRYRQREFRGPEPNSVAVLARKPGGRPVDFLVQQSREEEARRAELEAQVRSQKVTDLRSDWEVHTTKKLQKKTVQRRMDEHRRQMEQNIELRRDRLRELLESEEHSYLEEMDASQETVLERQAKMRDRAKFLREQKESERLKFVEMKLNEHWRERSEELRTNLQKRHLAEVIAERDNQVKLRDRVKEEQKQDEKYFHQLWTQELDAKAAREEKDVADRRRRELETVEVLEQQKAAFRARKEDELRLKEEEAQLLKEMEALRKIEAQQAAEEKRRKEHATRRMLDRNIRLRLRQQAKEAQEELAFDMKILEQLAEESRVEAENMAIRKQQLREEDRRYREYLRKMMEEEVLRERELEKLLDSEIEAQWQRRLDQWRKEKEARKKLMEQVMDERRRQIQERILANDRLQRESNEEKVRILAQIEELKAADRAEAVDRHRKNLAFGDELKEQINFNTHLRTLQEEERLREEARIQRERELELAKLRAAANMEWIDPKMHPLRQDWLAKGKPLY